MLLEEVLSGEFTSDGASVSVSSDGEATAPSSNSQRGSFESSDDLVAIRTHTDVLPCKATAPSSDGLRGLMGALDGSCVSKEE